MTPFLRGAILALILMVVLMLAGIAYGQDRQPCGPRSVMLLRALNAFGEFPVGYGQLEGKTMIELWLSPNRTWTIVRTLPSGWVCVIGSGSDWEFRALKLAPDGEPTG